MEDRTDSPIVAVESEEVISQDPLENIEDMLKKAARTPDETTLARLNAASLENRRRQLLEFMMHQEELNARGRGYQDPLLVESRLQYLDRASAVIPVFPTVLDSKGIPMSYTEEFLKELGVVEKDERIFHLFQRGSTFPLFDLNKPNQPVPEQPVRIETAIWQPGHHERDCMAMLPTKLDGVTAIVETERPYSVYLSLTPAALKKIKI